MLDTSYSNEFELQLKEAGYKWFKDNWKNSLRAFQKKFTDEKGTKYFITGYHWNFGKQLNRTGIEDRDQYSFDVQFNIDKKGKYQTIDIIYSGDFLPNEYGPVTTLKEVEDFYEKIWKDMNADYYELNNY